MKVTLIYCRPDPEAAIGLAAAECYDSRTDREACLRRAGHCVDSGHLATLRFASAHVHIEGISRVCSHQIVRVAHAGILQRSQRYVRESHVDYIVPPAHAELPPHLRSAWDAVLANAEAVYLAAIEVGMKKEDARFVLPQSCSTSLHMCGNFQFWRDFLRNRTSKHAQWEVRAVALEIQRLLAEQAPRVFTGPCTP